VYVCEQNKLALYAFTWDTVSTPHKPEESRTSWLHARLIKTNIFRRCHRSPVACMNIQKYRSTIFRSEFVRKHP